MKKTIVFAAIAALLSLTAISCDKENKPSDGNGATVALTVTPDNNDAFNSVAATFVSYRIVGKKYIHEETNRILTEPLNIKDLGCPCTIRVKVYYAATCEPENRDYSLEFSTKIDVTTSRANAFDNPRGMVNATGSQVKEYLDRIASMEYVYEIDKNGYINK